MTNDTTHPTGKPNLSRMLVLTGAIVLAAFIALPRIFTMLPSKMVGQTAPDFALSVVANGETGSRIKMSDLAGKPVVLSFWASWCGPCRAEAPLIDRLYKRLNSQGVHVLAVNTNDDPQRAAAFVHKNKLSVPVVSDEEGTTGDAYGVSSLPTIVIVDKHGKIAAVRKGMADASSLESLALSAR